MQVKRGKTVYDTEKSEVVKKITSGYFGETTGYEETLYVTENKNYFLYTNGGCDSKYPTEKITPLSKEKAENWLKENA